MVLSPAKLNLFLDVLHRRDDGYHELETLFVALDWGDDVTVTLDSGRDDVCLEVSGDDGVPVDETNLAWRAAAAWRAAMPGAPERPGVHVALTKRIPMGAGLGGGSSNAGTVLRELGAARPRDGVDLQAVAAELGSDVAFFLQSGAAIGRGRGERIERLPGGPSLDVVLILPPVACATPVVYGNLGARVRSAPESGLERAAFALQTGDAAALRAAHYNALAVPALGAYPVLGRFASDVERRLGRPPCLSGSGAALFDVPDPGTTPEILAALEGLPGRRVVATLCP